MRSAPLVALAALALAVPRPASAASRTFRQGVSGYTGTNDVSVSQELSRYWDPNENYNRTGDLAFSGNPVDIAGLIKFDLSSIPPNASVTSVTLTFNVQQNSGAFPIYELKKDFVETEATWNLASAGVPWEQPGASGASDRGQTQMGLYANPGGTTPHLYTLTLSLSGNAVVQGWVSNPSTNHGMILVDTAINSKATVSSADDADPPDRPMLTVTYAIGATPFTQSFQNGVSPSTAYSGTRDTSIGNGSIVNINGSDLRADGYEEDSAALIRFDVTAIPPWSTVTAVSMDGWVNDASQQTFPIYELLRDWSDSSATFLNADSLTPWSLRGAASTGSPAPADHGTTVLGLWTSRNLNTFNSTTLNRYGVKLVQDWIRGVRPNYGFIVQDYADATSDGSEWDEAGMTECDTAVPPNCVNSSPGLIVTYVEGRFVFNNSPQRIRVGTPSAAYVVQRQRADDGVPITAASAPALGVTVRSSSAGGAFALAATGPWSATLSVNISAGASDSQPFYYRDANAGNPTLTASLNTAWLNGTQVVSVGSLMLSDDVESGQVDAASGGQWSQANAAPSCSVAAATSSAHRGTFGLQVVDGDGQAGGGSQAAAQYLSAPVAPDLYFRTWFRYSGSNQLGDAQLASIGSGPLAAMSLVLPAQVVGGSGVADAGVTTSELGSVAVGEGSWHLLELLATNIGTTAGVRRTFVDGQLNTLATGLDWSGLGADVISAGEPASSDRRFTGTLDFDDLRASTTAPASHFLVVSPVTMALDACTPVAISLRDSLSNALVDGPYDFSAAVRVTGVPGTVFSDSTCRTPTTLVGFPQGVRTAIVYVSPTAIGDGAVFVSFPDFLDGSDSFTAVTGQPLAALPATSTVNPRNVVGFTASGGSGAGYQWSFLVNRSGASLSPGGVYVAGTTPVVTDVVQVTDSLGATATAPVHVVRDLALTPPRAVVFPYASVNFGVSGGAGAAGAHYGVTDNRSGGLVDPLSGVYVAGGTPGVDTVTVTDSRGSVASAAVQVLSPPELKVNVFGATSMGTGATVLYTFQVADIVGNVALPQTLQVRLLPLPGVPAPLGATMTSTFTGMDAGAPPATTLTLFTNASGSATAQVTSRVVERFLVCGALASAPGTETCLLVNVLSAGAHHVRADAVSPTATSCTPARVDVTVVDLNDNNVGFSSAVQLCAAAGSNATPISSTLLNPVIAGGCISGSTSAMGTASVFMVDGMDEQVTFTPSQAGLVNPPVTAQVTWSGRAPSPSQTLLELVGATDPAPLSTAPGSTVQVHVTPRDACAQPIAFAVGSAVALQVPPPLQAAGPTPDATGFSFIVSAPTCPPLPDPLPIHATLLGTPITLASRALATVNVQVTCRAPVFLSQGATAARCNQPYHYSDARVPQVDGDGPFVFRATGLPPGATLTPAGELVWTPTDGQVGPHAVDLTVTGAAGSATQTVNIDVACGSDVPPAPCGCAAAGATPLAVAALALLRAGLRRRRLR